jgi:hypothetical protein
MYLALGCLVGFSPYSIILVRNSSRKPNAAVFAAQAFVAEQKLGSEKAYPNPLTPIH